MWVISNLRWGHFFSLKVSLVSSSSFNHHPLPLPFLLSFFVPSSRSVWTHSPTELYFGGGGGKGLCFCCSPATPVPDQAAQGISGPLPFPSFLLYHWCHSSHVSSETPPDRAEEWEGGKGRSRQLRR